MTDVSAAQKPKRPSCAAADNDASNCPMPDTITVLLVDDHSLVRRGFRRLLEDDPSLTIVGEAGNGDEAVAGGAERGA
jgi:hypothetical protein